MKRGSITGITGQDSACVAGFPLQKGATVYGMVRRSGFQRFERSQYISDTLHLIERDLACQSSLDDAIKTIAPAEVYALTPRSFVPTSWTQPVPTPQAPGTGVTRGFEAIRKHQPEAKFSQAATREMFGTVQEPAQNETTYRGNDRRV
jgi:GDPmannose 4,6-dehydratase